MNSKLEAIAHLEKAFERNAKFRKDWKDYIEITIIEQLEKNKITLQPNKLKKLVNDCSENIFTLFQADWWTAQGLK